MLVFPFSFVIYSYLTIDRCIFLILLLILGLTIVVVIGLIVRGLYFNGASSDYVEIRVDGEVVAEYPLSENREEVFVAEDGGYNRIVIKVTSRFAYMDRIIPALPSCVWRSTFAVLLSERQCACRFAERESHLPG